MLAHVNGAPIPGDFHSCGPHKLKISFIPQYFLSHTLLGVLSIQQGKAYLPGTSHPSSAPPHSLSFHTDGFILSFLIWCLLGQVIR